MLNQFSNKTNVLQQRCTSQETLHKKKKIFQAIDELSSHFAMIFVILQRTKNADMLFFTDETRCYFPIIFIFEQRFLRFSQIVKNIEVFCVSMVPKDVIAIF